jgi:hypothetical protein
LKVPAVETLKTLKYGSLKHKWLKENGIETRQIERHVAASKLQPQDIFFLLNRFRIFFEGVLM